MLRALHSPSCTTLVEQGGRYMRRSARKVAHAVPPWMSGMMWISKFLDKNIYVYYHFDPNRYIENRASAR
jgi:hypothetical protein